MTSPSSSTSPVGTKPRRADDLGDLSDDLPSVAAALVALVDEQLPQKPWTDDARRVRRDVPAEHDKPDRFAAGIDGAAPGVGVRVLRGVLERLGDRPNEPLLLGSNAEGASTASRFASVISWSSMSALIAGFIVSEQPIQTAASVDEDLVGSLLRVGGPDALDLHRRLRDTPQLPAEVGAIVCGIGV